MNRRMKLALIAALLLVFAVGLPMANHYRAKRRAEAYRRYLQASGEPTRLEQLRPVLSPDEIRIAAELSAAASRLPPSVSNAPMMRFLAPGCALAACREPILPTEESTNVWPGLEFLAGQGQDALAQVRAVLAGSHGFGFNLDYSLGPNMLLPHLSRMKTMAQWLSLSASVEAHGGRITNAWEDLEAFAKLVTGFKKEPLMISELVRIAMAAIAINVTWDALQCPGWNDDQLELLGREWRELDLLAQAEAVLQAERCSLAKTFEAGRRSFSAVNFQPGGGPAGLAELAQVGKEIVDNPGEGLKSALHRYPGYWGWKYWQSYDDEIANGETLQAAIEAVRHARAAGVPALAVTEFESAAAKVRAAHPFTFKWLDYVPSEIQSRFLIRIRTVEIQRQLLLAAIALKRYEMRHGRYPDALASVAPEFIAEVPRDPMDGKPLRYRPNTDGTFLLYSIGEDGLDNDGKPAPRSDAPRQWWRARDAVWPFPGTPEQVQTEFRRVTDMYHNQIAAASNNAPGTVLDAFRRRYGLMPAQPQSTPATNK